MAEARAGRPPAGALTALGYRRFELTFEPLPFRRIRLSMKKASEYRQHAQECRELASHMESPDQRALMLGMADHWDKLAKDRMALILKHPELAHDGEHDEEIAAPASPAAP